MNVYISGKGKKTSTLLHKQKVGQANIKRVWSDESKQKLSEAHSGKTLSTEHKQKIGISTSGIKNGMSGTKWVHHIDKQLSLPIHPDKVNTYLLSGWVLGQKKYPDRNGKLRKISTLP